jgi:hypothetical protein
MKKYQVTMVMLIASTGIFFLGCSNPYKVQWRLITTDEPPVSMIMGITAIETTYKTEHTEWSKIDWPFAPGTMTAHSTKQSGGMTFTFDLYYDLYFIFQDGTVAEKHYTPRDIEAMAGSYIDVVPAPRKVPSDELISLLNAQGATGLRKQPIKPERAD